jgi:hypothetical protein
LGSEAGLHFEAPKLNFGGPIKIKHFHQHHFVNPTAVTLAVHSTMFFHGCTRRAIDLPRKPANWTATLGSTTGQHHWPALSTPQASSTGRHNWSEPLAGIIGQDPWQHVPNTSMMMTMMKSKTTTARCVTSNSICCQSYQTRNPHKTREMDLFVVLEMGPESGHENGNNKCYPTVGLSFPVLFLLPPGGPQKCSSFSIHRLTSTS